MPIYEYQCGHCDHGFEALVKNANAPFPVCPSCGSKRVVKQFSTFSASVASSSAPSCSMGKCPSGSCAGGGCQFERNG